MANLSLLRVSLKLLLLGGALVGTTTPALAGFKPYSVSNDLRYDTAVETHDRDVSLSRLTLLPEAKWRFGKRWRSEVSLRLEWADDETGLGTTDNYASHSRPWIKSNRARVELDKASISWRGSKHRITLGKQTVAWGVLDGVRITDRFDAVRQRDFIFTDTRPQRIARWGVQTQSKLGTWRLDTAVAFDATVSQQANLGDSFSPVAPRFTQGLRLQGSNAAITTASRNHSWRDATVGLRATRNIGQSSLSLLLFNGPTTDPIFTLDSIAAQPRLSLSFPKRTLLGLSWDRALGSLVLRGEAAYIPDQPINATTPAAALTTTRRSRWLAGVGVDWNAPLKLFVNAQLGVDRVSSGHLQLARPTTDTIATLRVQRNFRQAGWLLRCEWIGSLSDGDRLIRPAIVRELNDSISVTVGADLAYGDPSGQFGQFHERSRGWARLQVRW